MGHWKRVRNPATARKHEKRASEIFKNNTPFLRLFSPFFTFIQPFFGLFFDPFGRPLRRVILIESSGISD